MTGEPWFTQQIKLQSIAVHGLIELNQYLTGQIRRKRSKQPSYHFGIAP